MRKKRVTKKATREALEGSIHKWNKIAAGEGVDRGDKNCPLCKLFIKNLMCSGCPVAAVGYPGCTGSPYNDWVNSTVDEGGPNRILRTPTTSDHRRLAFAEAEFLRGLRAVI